MALDFTITTLNTLAAMGVPQTVTITLTGTGSLASTATFTATGLGSASAAPTLLVGAVAGASTTFTWAPSTTGLLTVTASGGLVSVKTLLFTVPLPRTTTANKIISQALGLLVIRAPGEDVDGTESSDLLTYLNTMLDGWRTQSLFAYTTKTFTGLVTANTRSVTIGPSGTIVTPYRPIRIEAGSFYTTAGLDFPITTITDTDYSSLRLKGRGGLGPNGTYYDATLPNGTLYLYPVPTGDVTLTLQALLEVEEFADLTTQYTLAPGYEKAIVYSFAEIIGPLYERDVRPIVAQQAAMARKAIRLVNQSTPSYDVPRSGGNVWVGWEY